MAYFKKDKIRAKRRKLRVRNSLKLDGQRLRVTIFRSLKHIHAQIVNDAQHLTVVSCSTIQFKDLQGTKKEQAYTIGLELAKRAIEKGIGSVVLDRGSSKYHGRVASLADGMREGGLQF